MGRMVQKIDTKKTKATKGKKRIGPADAGLREGPAITKDMQLLYASLDGRTDEMRKLLDAGADVNAKDKDGWTSLMIVSELGDIEAADLLRQYGAKD